MKSTRSLAMEWRTKLTKAQQKEYSKDRIPMELSISEIIEIYNEIILF